ncbi:hypothetical protein V6N11_064515 [Hibiscus sabdariffa]|uniref:Uncharacterized protein n=2 Tax=Hibiscus sabdariffa TaxID=183260 RepID=A0ABR2CBE4_9ROSI
MSSGPIICKSTWQETIDYRINVGLVNVAPNQEDNTLVKFSSEGEGLMVYFSEIWETKNKKEMKYGSLWEFQSKGLIEFEKRKRDHTCRRVKKDRRYMESSELSGRSLFDSELASMRNFLTKETRKTLSLGKNLECTLRGMRKRR